MNRRAFIKTAIAGGAVTSLSGCLGYTVTKEDKLNQLEQDSERIPELEGEISDLETQVQNLEENNSKQRSEIEGLEEDLNGAKDKQILYLYGFGITHYNSGIDYYDRARQYDSGEYDAIRADLNTAFGYFDSAATNFDAAAERAGELGADQVEEWCQDANSKSTALASAVSDYQVAMYYYNRGEDTEGDDRIERGNSHYESSQEYELKDRSDLEDELGASIE